MPKSGKIWTGTWMGIDAHVEVIGRAPVAFLSGRRAQFEGDVLGILGAAVVGLAVDEHRAVSEIGNVVASVAKELDPRDCDPDGNEPVWLPVRRMRDRLAKLEAALGYAVTQLEAANELLFEEEVRGEEDGVQIMRDWIHEIRAGLLKDGGRDGETSKG